MNFIIILLFALLIISILTFFFIFKKNSSKPSPLKISDPLIILDSTNKFGLHFGFKTTGAQPPPPKFIEKKNADQLILIPETKENSLRYNELLGNLNKESKFLQTNPKYLVQNSQKQFLFFAQREIGWLNNPLFNDYLAYFIETPDKKWIITGKNATDFVLANSTVLENFQGTNLEELNSYLFSPKTTSFIGDEISSDKKWNCEKVIF